MTRFRLAPVVALAALLSLASGAAAQRYYYLDSEYILNQMPEYKSVTEEIDQLSEQWEQQIETKQDAIRKAFDEYQARKVLLSDEDKQKRQAEIREMEKELAEFRAAKFGYDGELFKLREEKMRPVQERLLKALQDEAAEKRADYIFDKSSAAVILYAQARWDLTNDVLKRLGLEPNAPAVGIGTPGATTGGTTGGGVQPQR